MFSKRRVVTLQVQSQTLLWQKKGLRFAISGLLESTQIEGHSKVCFEDKRLQLQKAEGIIKGQIVKVCLPFHFAQRRVGLALLKVRANLAGGADCFKSAHVRFTECQSFEVDQASPLRRDPKHPLN